MPLINTAAKIYKGTVPAVKVYRGTVLVWPPAPPWGPDQTGFGGAAVAGTSEQGEAVTASRGNEFTFAAAGRVTALWFRSAPGDLSTTRVMRVWSVPGGTVLASATLTYTLTDGWFQVALPTPLAVSAGQTVRVSWEITAGDRVLRRTGVADGAVGDLTVKGRTYNSGAPNTYPNTLNATYQFVGADLTFQKAL